MVELSAAVVDLHPRNNTFPGGVCMRLAADVLADTVAAGARIEYEGLRERHLEEIRFRGEENRKLQDAVLCSAAVAGGLEPDLLDEVTWWGTDDFSRYGLLVAAAFIRRVQSCVRSRWGRSLPGWPTVTASRCPHASVVPWSPSPRPRWTFWQRGVQEPADQMACSPCG